MSHVVIAGGNDDGVAPIRVLFVCTHNSARSIMAEVLLGAKDAGAFEAWSAGTEPGEIQPLTLRVLREAGLPIDELRSKSVNEFIGGTFDFVVTVCDSARERCPAFPGAGKRLHWGFDDPSEVEGTEEERLEAFRLVFTAISQRVDRFVAEEALRPR